MAETRAGGLLVELKQALVDLRVKVETGFTAVQSDLRIVADRVTRIEAKFDDGYGHHPDRLAVIERELSGLKCAEHGRLLNDLKESMKALTDRSNLDGRDLAKLAGTMAAVVAVVTLLMGKL